MDSLRTLPAREVPLPGESLASLLRRTSEAMGYQDVAYITNLLPNKRLVFWNANRLRDELMLHQVAGLLGCSPEEILELTVHRYASRFVLTSHHEPQGQLCDTKTSLRYFATSAPVCSSCFRNDSVPYERLAWTLRPMPVCLDHRCLLLDRCPTCQRPLRLNRRLLLCCQCGSDIRDWQANRLSSEAVQLATKLSRWLRGDTPPLDGLSTAACFWWMDRIRASVEKTPEWLQQFTNEFGLPSETSLEVTAWLAAASLLRNWPARFTPFLDALQQTAQRDGASGIGRWFGHLPRVAAKLETLGYSTPADVLRDYLLNRYTKGHLNRKICLFKSADSRSRLAQRDWVTQTQAAKTIGLVSGSVRELVQVGILVGEVNDTGSRTAGLVSRDSVERLCQQLRGSLSPRQTSDRLGIGRHQVADLIRTKLLFAIRANRGWRIMQQSVESLETLYGSLPSTPHIAAHWLTARQATRNFGPSGLTIARLWANVAANNVRGHRLSGEKKLKGLVVSEQDIHRILPDIRTQYFREHGYPLNQLAKILIPGRPMKERVLKKWIAMGILRANRRGRAEVVSHDELECFRLVYCVASEACQLLGISHKSLARWKTEDRIQPVYGQRVTQRAGFSLYRRADIEHLQSTRAAKCFRRRLATTAASNQERRRALGAVSHEITLNE